MRRTLICMTGSGSTGKTVLSHLLAGRLGFEYREAPTRVISAKQDVTKEGQDKILQLYIQFFESLTTSTVATRSIFDVMAYSKAYGVWSDDYIEQVGYEYVRSNIYPNMIFYLPVEFDAVGDGERDRFFPKRNAVDVALIDILQHFGVTFTMLSGNVDARLRCALLDVARGLGR